MANENNQVVDIADEDISEVSALPEAKEGETIDWEAQAKHFKGIADRRTTKLSKIKESQKVTPAPKPNESESKIGFGEKAFLASVHDVKHADDVAYVEKAMKDSGKSLEEIMASPFIKAELKRIGEERTTKEASPGPDNRNAQPARDKVEYWIAKGEMPPADQPELRRAYVNAKLAKEKSKNQFTDTPVVQ